MGTPEIVVKRAFPCSSRFVPVGAPIGFSGVFSSVGASVFSAQSFSAAVGCRPSKTSAIGLSATFGLFLGMRPLISTQRSLLTLDDTSLKALFSTLRHAEPAWLAL